MNNEDATYAVLERHLKFDLDLRRSRPGSNRPTPAIHALKIHAGMSGLEAQQNVAVRRKRGEEVSKRTGKKVEPKPRQQCQAGETNETKRRYGEILLTPVLATLQNKPRFTAIYSEEQYHHARTAM